MNKTFITKTQQQLNTIVHLPKDYDKTKQYPLMLFLHGSGERGNSVEDLDRIKNNWPLSYSSAFKGIILAPQCPVGSYWPMLINNLDDLLNQAISDYAVDEKRIYLTGLSMGGYGAWYMGFAYPNRFAAIVPICGGGIPSSAEVLSPIPIWAFHGRKDDVVPVDETVSLANKIKALNGNIKVTLYDDIGHDAWVKAYQNEALYAWLNNQKKH